MRHVAVFTLALGSLFLLLAEPVRAEAIHRETLPNGAVVIVQSRPATGTFALRVMARGGRFEDPADKHGLTSLLSRMLLRGTTRLSAYEHALAIERTGSTAGPLALRLAVGLSASGPAEAVDEVFDLVMQAALRPRMAPEDLDKEVGLMRQSLQTSLDRPSTALDRAAFPLLFGDHPLGRIADPETWLDGFTIDDVRAAHRKRFTGRRMVIVIVGDVDALRTLARAESAAGSLPPGSVAGPAPASPAPLGEPVRVRARQSTSQPELLVARPTTGLPPSSNAAMDLLMHMMTGVEERLSSEIRERRGWAYWVRGVDWRFPNAGLYGVRTAVPKKHLEEAATIILQELSWIGEEPPSLDELGRAKRFLLTSRARSWQKSANRGAWFAAWELKGKPLMTYEDYARSLEAVTPRQVRDLARRLDEHSAPAVVTLY